MKLKLFFVTLMISACSNTPMNNQDYWRAKGYRLGELGYESNSEKVISQSQRENYDESAFMAGYASGREVYCSPESAFKKGIEGTKYKGQCEDSPNSIRIRAEWERGWHSFISMGTFRWR
ncbi:DUF2799 domain-containing protein [Vibrio hangzhouensis]|uniref:DUF2799 domain-containing protein n=1 Tax=Vibrio hangzhouensis TaxID=462991 RepID=UPI001C983A06|nr:DUF2799 domain-containing protein [Vibrio hangzhouensis]MBY6197576.1 DUF2799 domain-containing protein [Vibrio hangzhouensis]